MAILLWGGVAAASEAPRGEKPEPESPEPRADRARGYVEPRSTEPEDVALFVPRLVLTVPRYALKVVFFPILGTIAFLDRHAVIEHVEDFLYNDARTAGVVPVLSADTFFGPTFGVRAFHDDFGGHRERASVEARFGGRYEQAYQIEFRGDRVGGSRLWLESLARFEREPQLLFQGIGHPPELSSGRRLDPRGAAVASRFREQRFLSLLRLGYTAGRQGSLAKFGFTAIYNQRSFGAAADAADPATESVYDTSRLPGYAEGFSTVEMDVSLVVDTRDAAGATSSGIYFEVFAGGVPPLREYGFWHHGLEATGYVNLYAKTRVLIARLTLEGVEGPWARIPFSELPRMGGPHRLRGYPLDRFRDEKLALATLEYRYPVHQYVAGALHVDVGRVAKDYENLFRVRDWVVGVGGGLVFRSRSTRLFAVNLAYGEGLQLHVTTDPLRAFATRDTEL